MLNYNQNYPNFIKYMGSKSNLLDFVITGLSEAYIPDGHIVDLFSGSATLSGALRGHYPVISNDIQSYSKIISNAYLNDYDWEDHPHLIQDVINIATGMYNDLLSEYNLNFDYTAVTTLEEFEKLELKQQKLIKKRKWNNDYHLFTKYYSGTYWSYDQCLWIDSYRYAAEQYINTPYYDAIMASLMFAMSYNAQSTGHYAQYRVAKNEKSMNDIMLYRLKSITPFFERKMIEIRDNIGHNNNMNFQSSANDYMDCLNEIPNNSIIYADPPYCFVHYSRFYHAIETLVRYDYPKVLHKGRYRDDRHQSPFCIKSKVNGAFEDMFNAINQKQSNMVLSYSNTGMITFDEIVELANECFDNYDISILTTDYKHSTMGRLNDKSRDVKEALIIAKQV